MQCHTLKSSFGWRGDYFLSRLLSGANGSESDVVVEDVSMDNRQASKVVAQSPPGIYSRKKSLTDFFWRGFR